MKREGLYFVIDGSNSRCGITDRIKAAVGLYYIARRDGVRFKFIHQTDFDIRDYLAPNEVDWSAELSEISPLPWMRRRVDYLPPFDGIPELRRGRQYVCRRYIGKNIIEMSGVPDWQRVWRESAKELFRPGEKVLKALSEIRMPGRYTVINARFVNSLGWNEDSSYNSPLPDGMKRRLMDAVLDKAVLCAEGSDAPAIVYSDSRAFLEAAAERGLMTCDPQGIGHIMNPDTTDMVKLMTFVNFIHISRAEKIYSILNVEGFPSNSLYKTQYPRYAAILGDRPFVRL